MYAEYYAGNRAIESEYAVTFERSEAWQYKAYVTGVPCLQWDEETQSWTDSVSTEVFSKETRGKDKYTCFSVHERMLLSSSNKARSIQSYPW